MKSQDIGKMIQRGLAIILISSPAVAWTACPRSTEKYDIKSVEAYLASGFEFSSDLARDAALSGDIQPVTEWPLFRKWKHHRLYSFPINYSTPFAFGLVAVSDRGEVTLLKGLRGFNSVLREEGFEAEGNGEVEELARTFLRTQRFSVYKTEHLDLGIQVVSSAEDIPYPNGAKGEAQRELVSSQFGVHPPKLEHVNGRFKYTLFGWSYWGGAVSRYVVILEPTEIIDYKVTVLGQWIGRHGVGY